MQQQQLGLAYGLLLNDSLIWYSALEEMVEQVKFWRRNRQDYPHTTSISFYRSVYFECTNIEESKRIFDREAAERN